MEKPRDFDVISIQVGSWKRNRVNHHRDLVFKCHYKKKKFLWEVLDHTLNMKSKVEILWNDVDAMSLTEDSDGGGSLEILVTKTPNFFCERDRKKGKKDPKWCRIEDFTDDHVTPNKCHVLRFEPGVYAKLDQHIQNVANANPNLKKLLFPIPNLEKEEDKSIRHMIAVILSNLRPLIHYPIISQSHHHRLAHSSQPYYFAASPNSARGLILPHRNPNQDMQYHNVIDRNKCAPQFIINQGGNPQPQAYYHQPISMVAPASNPHYEAPSNPSNNCHINIYANDMINQYARDNQPYVRREQQACQETSRSTHHLVAFVSADRNGSFICPPMDGSNIAPSTLGSKDGNGVAAQDQIDELYFRDSNL